MTLSKHLTPKLKTSSAHVDLQPPRPHEEGLRFLDPKDQPILFILYTIELKTKFQSARQLCLVQDRQWKKSDVTIENRGFFSRERPWKFKHLGGSPNGQNRLFSIQDYETNQYLAHPPNRPEDETQSWVLSTCPVFHKDLTVWEVTATGHIAVPRCVSDGGPIRSASSTTAKSTGSGNKTTMVLSTFVGASQGDEGYNYDGLKPCLRPEGLTHHHQTWQLRTCHNLEGIPASKYGLFQYDLLLGFLVLIILVPLLLLYYLLPYLKTLLFVALELLLWMVIYW